ncbi:MAG: hypothetical protein ABSG55_08310 [Dehalococcoidia bacterium]
MQALISGLTTTSSKLAAWPNSQGTVIGGVMILSLVQPATLAHEWRSVSWADSSRTTYVVTVYTAKLSNITTIDIWVDLQKGVVVGWSPNSDATIVTPPTIVATVTE